MARFEFVIAVALTGCRADVQGFWTGEVEGTKATLSLDQTGGIITGAVCMAHVCDDIDDGVLEEESLMLTFGCNDCVLRRTTLDLVLVEGSLEGDAYLWDCTCTGCSCRRQALLHRCRGPC